MTFDEWFKAFQLHVEEDKESWMPWMHQWSKDNNPTQAKTPMSTQITDSEVAETIKALRKHVSDINSTVRKLTFEGVNVDVQIDVVQEMGIENIPYLSARCYKTLL